mmetsp:Transcript_23274/g.66179  ORF Transcript_23274/g.66179 Transcript_23274/m.66179 type:complete len:102 (+) Transcript_23274:117-422(+)
MILPNWLILPVALCNGTMTGQAASEESGNNAAPWLVLVLVLDDWMRMDAILRQPPGIISRGLVGTVRHKVGSQVREASRVGVVQRSAAHAVVAVHLRSGRE